MKGKVKFFNVKNGFGFILGEDGNEYFVHKTGLKPGTKLFENDEVSFDVTEGERGPKAIDVNKIGGSPQKSSKPSRDTSEMDDEEE